MDKTSNKITMMIAERRKRNFLSFIGNFIV